MEKLLQRVSNGYESAVRNERLLTSSSGPQLCPDADFTKELGGVIDKDKWKAEAAAGAGKRPGSSKKTGMGDTSVCRQHKSGYASESLEDGLVPSDDERMLVRLTDPPKNQVPPVIEKRCVVSLGSRGGSSP